MTVFSKESLEALRQRVDLVEVLSSYVEFKRSGAAYKGLCPFHDEKTPSFIIHKGDSHYHCFGCGAHGDAIEFLMTQQKMSFLDAVESLAQRFGVHLEKIEGNDERKGPPKNELKEALEKACSYYQFCLLYTPEGHEALAYLYSRGIGLPFIEQFRIGLAPKTPSDFRKVLHAQFVKNETLEAAGLLQVSKDGYTRDFFSDRIMFPVHHHSGHLVGFSGRKYKEDTYGGKYVNTPETELFKKSRILFGLNYSRKRIAKERRAIIVEGQIDALRLIQAGFTITVAGQGTAFGEGHVKELVSLGINLVYLALDPDTAGREAAYKIGHLFQKEAIEVKVVSLPTGSDPDAFLQKNGSAAFVRLLEESEDYINFLIKHLSRDSNLESPAAKNELIVQATKLIREWDHPVMVHETLRKLAHLLKVPENIVGVGQEVLPTLFIKKSGSIGVQTVDPDRILETDLLRWLLLLGQEPSLLVDLILCNVSEQDLLITDCQKIFTVFKESYQTGRPRDLLSLAIDLDDTEGQLVMSDLLRKKVNKERADTQIRETIKKILDRNWMHKREEIKIKIQSGLCSDEEVLGLLKQFDELKRNPPCVADLPQPVSRE